MKTNFIYETPEEQDDLIQSLSISDLKANLIGKSVFKGKPDNVAIQEDYSDLDFELQNLTIDELKQLAVKSVNNFEKYPIRYKIVQTGLDANTILLIETNKYRATLQELMLYCKGLNISYKSFLPELFKTEMV